MTRGRITLAVMLFLALILLTLSACSGQQSVAKEANTNPVKQTLVKARLQGDLITLPVSEVDTYTNTRFKVTTATSNLTFMAYNYGGKLTVRADICPPCRSESFTLTKGTLVCDACGTVFDANDGSGIRGACVRYPKQSVPYEIKDGEIVMRATDMLAAYQKTLNPS